MECFFAPSGKLRPQAQALVHYSQHPLSGDETGGDVLALALAYAAKMGQVRALERLLELGAKVNARPPFDHRATALHWAVVGGHAAALRWLLEHGADPSLRDQTWDSTPRGWAEEIERAESAALLDSWPKA